MAGKYAVPTIPLKGKTKIKVYASPKVSDALRESRRTWTCTTA